MKNIFKIFHANSWQPLKMVAFSWHRSYKNSIWVNNGIESKFVNKDHIPEGYSKGRIFKCTKRKLSSAKNSIWVNNGIISKMVQPDQIPNGFVHGRLTVNKHEQK